LRDQICVNAKKASERGAAFFSLDDWDKLRAGAERQLLSAKAAA